MVVDNDIPELDPATSSAEIRAFMTAWYAAASTVRPLGACVAANDAAGSAGSLQLAKGPQQTAVACRAVGTAGVMTALLGPRSRQRC